MDELRLMRELGDETPLPDEASLAPARAKFLAGMAERGPVRLRKRRSRFAVVGTSAIGLAAAVAATITLIPVGQSPSGGQAAATVPESSAAQPVTDAVRLLNHAARVARAEPADPPRPDQFVYQRHTSHDGTEEEFWRSVDGTLDGLARGRTGREAPIPGCRDGRRAAMEGLEVVPGVTVPCEPQPAYFSHLPTDVDGMVSYLRTNPDGAPIEIVPSTMARLTVGSQVPPLAMAALYEALARTPGVTVVPDVRDAAGRPGIGVNWVESSVSPRIRDHLLFVFDPNTYELLGVGSTAITGQGVVDQVGQRP